MRKVTRVLLMKNRQSLRAFSKSFRSAEQGSNYDYCCYDFLSYVLESVRRVTRVPLVKGDLPEIEVLKVNE